MPVPTYPLYTAVLAKIGAHAGVLPDRSREGWQPDLDHLRSLITPRTRALVLIDPNNPTGAVYPRATKLALLDIAEQHTLPLVRRGLRRSRVRRSGRAARQLESRCAVISFSSLSKAYLAPGWRAGWLAVGRTPRLNDVLAGDQEAGGRPAVQPGADAYAITAALTGDRSHQETFNKALRERARR